MIWFSTVNLIGWLIDWGVPRKIGRSWGQYELPVCCRKRHLPWWQNGRIGKCLHSRQQNTFHDIAGHAEERADVQEGPGTRWRRRQRKICYLASSRSAFNERLEYRILSLSPSNFSMLLNLPTCMTWSLSKLHVMLDPHLLSLLLVHQLASP